MTEDVPAECRPLRYVDIPKTIKLIEDAFRDNPYHSYVDDNPEGRRSAFLTLKWRTPYLFLLLNAVRNREAWAIHSDAVVVFQNAPSTMSNRRKATDNLVRRFTTLVLRTFLALSTKEQQDRTSDVSKKMKEARSKTIADRTDEMIHLHLIATSPDMQGRGYGTTLAEVVTAKAEAEGRAVYLTSTNIVNERFYESHGFRTIAEVTVGEDKSSWTRPPVVVHLMLRECKA